jgi:hypothetical protein
MIAKFGIWFRKKLHNPTNERIDLTSVGALASLIALSFALPGLMPCGHLLVAKETFVQVDLQVMLVEPHQHLFQRLEVPVVSVGVDQYVVNVDHNVLQSPEYLLH